MTTAAAVPADGGFHGPFEIKAKHETVFSVFLLALAFLFRRDPSIQYPEILYVFVLFLAFNFLYNRFLKQKARNVHLAYSPVFINGILITWAVHYSGGPSSYLWVMYLLPVFTACLLYDIRGIVLSTAYVLALHASVYESAFWRMDALEGLQFLSKAALLVLSSSLTARLAYAEREAQSAAAAQRRSYEESLGHLWGHSPAGNGRGEPVESLLMGGIHDVNTALSIILGSTQLLLMQEDAAAPGREDLARIESAVRLGKVLLQNIALLGRPRADWPRQTSSLHDILREALEQCRGEIRSKGSAVESRFDAKRDEVFVNTHLFHQAFVNFLFAAVAATPVGGRLRVFSRSGEGEKVDVLIEDGGTPVDPEGRRRFFDPHWIAPGRGKGVGLGLYLGREIILRHGGEADVETGEGGGNRLRLRLPLHQGKAEGAPVQLKDLVAGT